MDELQENTDSTSVSDEDYDDMFQQVFDEYTKKYDPQGEFIRTLVQDGMVLQKSRDLLLYDNKYHKKEMHYWELVFKLMRIANPSAFDNCRDRLAETYTWVASLMEEKKRRDELGKKLKGKNMDKNKRKTTLSEFKQEQRMKRLQEEKKTTRKQSVQATSCGHHIVGQDDLASPETIKEEIRRALKHSLEQFDPNGPSMSWLIPATAADQLAVNVKYRELQIRCQAVVYDLLCRIFGKTEVQSVTESLLQEQPWLRVKVQEKTRKVMRKKQFEIQIEQDIANNRLQKRVKEIELTEQELQQEVRELEEERIRRETYSQEVAAKMEEVLLLKQKMELATERHRLELQEATEELIMAEQIYHEKHAKANERLIKSMAMLSNNINADKHDNGRSSSDLSCAEL